jgi:transcriptional regulator with XRE-family HTH domain
MNGDESFGRRMRRLRKARDLTQEALAQQVFCATDTIKKLEQGLRRPSRQLAAQLANCLDLRGDEHEVFLADARAVPQDHDSPPPAADQVGPAALSGAVASLDDGIPSTLPAQQTALIGREREIAQVCELLGRADVRLLTLTDPAALVRPAWPCRLPPSCVTPSPTASPLSHSPRFAIRRW